MKRIICVDVIKDERIIIKSCNKKEKCLVKVIDM